MEIPSSLAASFIPTTIIILRFFQMLPSDFVGGFLRIVCVNLKNTSAVHSDDRFSISATFRLYVTMTMVKSYSACRWDM